MSGSGGGGGDWRREPTAPIPTPKAGGDGGGGLVGNDPCVIEEYTSLNSVDAVVLRNVRVGDTLPVVFIAGPPRLVVQDHQRNNVGAITSRSLLTIIQCIQDGRNYVADVLLVSGGLCNVKVRLA
ncbi:hypothetical protein [Burkholderia sp. A1]|uniref:hypothetical protein n=1 Tax=Burkholderia sp. A1 TaxID=148446 RepID=UPI001268CF1A|nr:hypothetical protein [Burkholderia sp. A1]